MLGSPGLLGADAARDRARATADRPHRPSVGDRPHLLARPPRVEHGPLDDAAYAAHFADLESRFEAAWSEERGAILADLPKLDPRGHDLRSATANEATLIGAELSRPRLEEADLSWARLEVVFLSGADLKTIKWSGAVLHSPVHSADLRGALGLTQEQLENTIGDTATLLPDNPPLNVYTCWTNPPKNLEALRQRAQPFDEHERDRLRTSWACGPDNPRRETGTPLSLDAPYPQGHSLANLD